MNKQRKEAEELIYNVMDTVDKTKTNEIPDYSEVPKDQLRLFRNLIYARNGYTFKSADLREYYSSCSWYKQNPNFNESAMRKDEKDFIELMLKYEAK